MSELRFLVGTHGLGDGGSAEEILPSQMLLAKDLQWDHAGPPFLPTPALLGVFPWDSK